MDKYIDYYKWLDDALGEMLVELVPASLAHSDGINNVIENYVFARDKYFNKYPTIEFQAPDIEGGMNTINRHLYPWKTGHAPNPREEDDNCFWWLERAERALVVPNSVAPSDLPANSIHVTANGEVWYKFSVAISDFNFRLSGLQFTGVEWESYIMGTNGWNTPGRNTNLGFINGQRGTGTNIPAGSGVLFKFLGTATSPFVQPLGFHHGYKSFKNASGQDVGGTITYVSLPMVGANADAGILHARQKVFQARNSVLNRGYTTAQHFVVDKSRHLHGGTNYEPNKKRDYMWSATKEMSESPLTFGQFGGFPLQIVSPD